MNVPGAELAGLLARLRHNPALARKQDIQSVAAALGRLSSLGAGPGAIDNGDDAAAIPDADGYTLIAAEGMLPAFVEREPWFAGFCALMANVSDIAAMGGRASALVDVLFIGEDDAIARKILAGLTAASEVFQVPVVGGHTCRTPGATSLAAAVVGRARRLITSYAARPGDVVLACVDLRGDFRGQSDNFDAVSGADPAALRAQLSLLPMLAETERVHAGKDISMAGMLGTLLMLLETSGVGAVLDLDAVPAPERQYSDDVVAPAGSGKEDRAARWLRAFPSFGYLLVTTEAHAEEVCARFGDHGVSAAKVAEVTPGRALDVVTGGERERFWDLSEVPLVGFRAGSVTSGAATVRSRSLDGTSANEGESDA